MYKCEHPTNFTLGWGIPLLLLATASILITLCWAACKCVVWIAEHPWARILCGTVISIVVCIYAATYSETSECDAIADGQRHPLIYLPITSIILFIAASCCEKHQLPIES
jgi:hypothetical protein